jgi:hypothetical protein
VETKNKNYKKAKPSNFKVFDDKEYMKAVKVTEKKH